MLDEDRRREIAYRLAALLVESKGMLNLVEDFVERIRGTIQYLSDSEDVDKFLEDLDKPWQAE